MTAEVALILGIDGLANGAVYLLAGLGLVLIFSVTRVVFVPFGDVAAFAALSLAALETGRMPATVWMVGALALLALAVEVRSLALHFLLSGLGLLFFGPEGSRTAALVGGAISLAGFSVSGQVLLMVGAAVVLSALFFLAFERTVAGKALRATAVNRIGARLVGIRPARTALLAYTFAGLLGGLIGILVAPGVTLYYDSGFIIGLKA